MKSTAENQKLFVLVVSVNLKFGQEVLPAILIA